MGRLLLRPVPDKNILASVLLVPLTVIFLASAVECWPRFFGSAPVARASAARFDPPSPIDGKRAYEYLKKICEIGPRTAGSKANDRQREMVKKHFTKMGAVVTEQRFRIQHPQTGAPLTLYNLVGSWHPERLERVVIGAHYDTRPHPDQEDDPKRHAMPFLGANDCASGVALEMEIAHHLNDLNTRWGVDLVLFDGEELVFGNNNPPVGKYFLGSQEFARRYAARVASGRKGPRYAAGIVLDMVGGRDQQITQDPKSLEFAPELVRQVWLVADSLKAKSFKYQQGREVQDDHLPLNEVGIPTIDIIDFEYPFWHKADDLPENCSAESLEEVGRVLTAWLAARPQGAAPPKARKRR
jgi:glutaminyl-peptide cyclotransferase